MTVQDGKILKAKIISAVQDHKELTGLLNNSNCKVCNSIFYFFLHGAWL